MVLFHRNVKGKAVIRPVFLVKYYTILPQTEIKYVYYENNDNERSKIT